MTDKKRILTDSSGAWSSLNARYIEAEGEDRAKVAGA